MVAYKPDSVIDDNLSGVNVAIDLDANEAICREQRNEITNLAVGRVYHHPMSPWVNPPEANLFTFCSEELVLSLWHFP